ncbi:MAG TPA: RICIN domain-containing protein [Polyangiaceae bacterium]|jgi:hypothetical protein
MKVTACALSAMFLVAGCSGSAPEESAQGEQAVGSAAAETLQTRVNNSSCMDVRGDSSANGTQIQESACNGGASQVFQIATSSAGLATIVHAASGKCVDVRGSGTANGTKVELWSCNGTGAQTFRVQDDGNGAVTFVNANSGKCLDISGSNPADGTRVQLWDCNGTNAQAWTRVSAGGGSSPDAGTPGQDSSAPPPDAGASDSGGGGLPPGASDWLTPMNAARAAVGEAPFTWDPIAAQVAQSWASQCSWGHNPSAGSEYSALGGSGGLGEDVAAGAPSQSVSDAVASWVSEGQYYDHATNSCAAGQECGHYTQIVWKNSTAVGCAKVHCTTGSPFGAGFPTWDMSVCDFNPPGNYVGESPY